MASVINYVYWRGGKFNQASIASLLRAEKLSGLAIRVMQGGFNAGRVKVSAGTHDGGGVVDISVRGWSQAQIRSMLTWLRRCGWAAWYRTPRQGFVYHIHAVRIGDNSASWGAKAQVVAYRRGRNGLAGNGYDDGPKIEIVTWEKSKHNPANTAKPKHLKPLMIKGKAYKPINTVSVFWINKARKAGNVSRHVYFVEAWLTNLGYNRDGRNDGKWSKGLQADLDAFRWDHRKTLGIRDRAGAGGDVGLGSLTLMRNLAKSPRKVKAGQ